MGMQVARFVPNPEAYWGPKPKAGRPQRVRPLSFALLPFMHNRIWSLCHFSQALFWGLAHVLLIMHPTPCMCYMTIKTRTLELGAFIGWRQLDTTLSEWHSVNTSSDIELSAIFKFSSLEMFGFACMQVMGGQKGEATARAAPTAEAGAADNAAGDADAAEEPLPAVQNGVNGDAVNKDDKHVDVVMAGADEAPRTS